MFCKSSPVPSPGEESENSPLDKSLGYPTTNIDCPQSAGPKSLGVPFPFGSPILNTRFQSAIDFCISDPRMVVQLDFRVQSLAFVALYRGSTASALGACHDLTIVAIMWIDVIAGLVLRILISAIIIDASAYLRSAASLADLGYTQATIGVRLIVVKLTKELNGVASREQSHKDSVAQTFRNFVSTFSDPGSTELLSFDTPSSAARLLDYAKVRIGLRGPGMVGKSGSWGSTKVHGDIVFTREIVAVSLPQTKIFAVHGVVMGSRGVEANRGAEGSQEWRGGRTRAGLYAQGSRFDSSGTGSVEFAAALGAMGFSRQSRLVLLASREFSKFRLGSEAEVTMGSSRVTRMEGYVGLRLGVSQISVVSRKLDERDTGVEGLLVQLAYGLRCKAVQSMFGCIGMCHGFPTLVRVKRRVSRCTQHVKRGIRSAKAAFGLLKFFEVLRHICTMNRGVGKATGLPTLGRVSYNAVARRKFKTLSRDWVNSMRGVVNHVEMEDSSERLGGRGLPARFASHQYEQSVSNPPRFIEHKTRFLHFTGMGRARENAGFLGSQYHGNRSNNDDVQCTWGLRCQHSKASLVLISRASDQVGVDALFRNSHSDSNSRSRSRRSSQNQDVYRRLRTSRISPTSTTIARRINSPNTQPSEGGDKGRVGRAGLDSGMRVLCASARLGFSIGYPTGVVSKVTAGLAVTRAKGGQHRMSYTLARVSVCTQHDISVVEMCRALGWMQWYCEAHSSRVP
ncbi:hypothetical protein DFP72DRAFT_859170 [Ephemerocybe angulata]|uniref:Uncharacterized protein n=1 Tax=Ephemerocybe angulata TaxID=980116 RepID=A0A8H6HBT7_9AGAR|nr:hypothetical protein DFP72DRAFT_859170 [Tulosesus angulatus]